MKVALPVFSDLRFSAHNRVIIERHSLLWETIKFSSSNLFLGEWDSEMVKYLEHAHTHTHLNLSIKFPIDCSWNILINPFSSYAQGSLKNIIASFPHFAALIKRRTMSKFDSLVSRLLLTVFVSQVIITFSINGALIQNPGNRVLHKSNHNRK